MSCSHAEETSSGASDSLSPTHRPVLPLTGRAATAAAVSKRALPPQGHAHDLHRAYGNVTGSHRPSELTLTQPPPLPLSAHRARLNPRSTQLLRSKPNPS